MIQEDKDLLLKDLCGRLPYHPYINVCNDSWEGYQPGEFDTNLYSQHIGAFVCDRIEIKPYLRPMSSMTEEENSELGELITIYDDVDWMLAHHFDVHNLIDKGLAIEAPEGMYKTE